MPSHTWIGQTRDLPPRPTAAGRGLITPRHLSQSLIDSLAERARLAPDAVAVFGADAPLSVGALWTGVRRLAWEIIGRRLPGGPVAVVTSDPASAMVALFASGRAGRPCLVLDAHHPVERNDDLLRRAGAVLAIGGAERPGGKERPPMVATAHAFAETPIRNEPFPSPLGIDDPAFLIATSGSSGVPKLFALSQRNVILRAEAHVHAATTGPDDVVACLSSIAVVGGLYTMLAFPLAGVPVLMIDLARGGFRGVLASLQSHRVTLLRAGVSTLRAMATLPDAASALAGLRVVTAYGEALTRADAALLVSVLPPEYRLFVSYGSTEATATGWYAGPADDYDPVRCPAGIVRANVEILIADDDGNAVPRGQVGELWVRGPAVALGQWDTGTVRPIETAPDRPGWRVHRTGDLARMTPDDMLVVLGRKDRMASINGQRVEPAEVEAALRALPGIQDAVVLARVAGDRVWLHAFVVRAPGIDLDARAALRQALPAHMIPTRVTALDAIPMLPTGKPDLPALERMDEPRPPPA